MNAVTYTESLHLGVEFLQAPLFVGAGDIHGNDVFDSPPVDEECKGGPAPQAGDDFRGDTGGKQFARTTDTETVATNGGEAGRIPGRGAEIKEEGFGRGSVAGWGREGEHRGRGRDIRVHRKVEVQGLDRAEVVITSCQENRGTILFRGFGPRDMEGGAEGSVADRASCEFYRAGNVQGRVKSAQGRDGKFA